MDKILRNKKAIFIFIAPALIMFVLVLVIPMVQMVYYSLCDYAALTPPKFTGLANYKKLFFKDSTFKIALKNSIFFMIFSAITQQVIGLGLAVMLTNIKKGRNLFKNIYYLPSVLSSAALGLFYVALRQTSAQFLAETEFTLKGQPKDRAGIAYIQNDQNYLCVEYEEDESYGRVYVTACIGGENKILAERKTEIRLCQNLRLKVNKNCAEAWLKKGDIWECVLEDMDISYMSTESAGGFTGCTVGMYTHSGEKQSSGYTKFYRFVLK